jgi:hypothetical protein
MAPVMLGGLLLLGLLALHSLALYGLCAPAATTPDQRRAVLAAALCLGPLFAAWLLSKLWLVWPALPLPATLTLLAGLPAVTLGLAWKRLRAGLPPLPAGEGAVGWALVFAVAILSYAALRVPLYSNDPLEYAGAARVILDSRASASYPVLDTATSGGFYAPWTHPPGFPCLIALASMVGMQDVATAVKSVAAIHFGLLVSALWLLAGASGAWIAMLVLVGAPAYALGVVNGYVESVRVTAIVGVLALLLACREWPLRAAWLPASAGLALCGFAHSLGLLLGFWILPAWLLLRSGAWWRRLGEGAALLAGQLMLLGPELASNLRHFGVPLGDRPLVWEIERVGRKAYFEQFRGLDTAADRLFVGILQGFTQLSNFGFSYWVAALALLAAGLAARGRRGDEPQAVPPQRDPLVLVSAGTVAAYYASVVLLTSLGSVEAIKNARYTLTVQPFVALLLARVLTRPARRPRWLRAVVPAALLCSALPSLLYVVGRFPDAIAGTLAPRAAYFTYLHPESDVVAELDHRLSAGGCALVFRQADSAVYGRHCFRSYLDHRLAAVYTSAAPAEASARLRGAGLTHVVTPDYAMPEVYNTEVGALLSDPALSELVWSRGGYQIYRLRDAPVAIERGAERPLSLPGLEDGAPGRPMRLEFARDPDESPLMRLCIEASGRGRLELSREPEPAVAPMARVLAALQSSRSGYITAIGVSGPKRWCVQLLGADLVGPLRLAMTDNVSVTAITAAAYRLRP